MTLASLSLQLYTVRRQLDEDLPGTLARVAAIGYRQVESSMRLLSRGAEFLDPLRAAGLASPTMTSPLMDADLAEVFAAARAVGAHTVIESNVPDEFWAGTDAVARIADRLNVAARVAADHGLRIGYHNHWWELERRFDGRSALETLVDRLRPEVILEVDAYWAAVGGEEVPALLGRLGERVRLLHIKDGPVSRDNTQQRPAGRGAMPWPRILDAVPHVEAGAVEFDEYAGDIFEGIAASHAYLAPMVAGAAARG